jgi:hypothetical protein
MSTPDAKAPTPTGMLVEALGGRFAVMPIVTKIADALTTDEIATLARTIEEVSQRAVQSYGVALEGFGAERRLQLARGMAARWDTVSGHG